MPGFPGFFDTFLYPVASATPSLKGDNTIAQLIPLVRCEGDYSKAISLFVLILPLPRRIRDTPSPAKGII